MIAEDFNNAYSHSLYWKGEIIKLIYPLILICCVNLPKCKKFCSEGVKKLKKYVVYTGNKS